MKTFFLSIYFVPDPRDPERTKTWSCLHKVQYLMVEAEGMIRGGVHWGEGLWAYQERGQPWGRATGRLAAILPLIKVGEPNQSQSREGAVRSWPQAP